MTPLGEANHTIRAAIWMLGAVIGFSLMAIAGRTLSAGLDTFEIMTFRSVIALCVVCGVALAGRSLSQISARALHLHFGRNVSHFIGQNLWLYALTLIPLAQLFAFEFSYPMLVGLGAALFLGERLTTTKVVCAVFGFLGILLVAGIIDIFPTGASDDAVGSTSRLGMFAAMACAFGFAGSALFTKTLTHHGQVSILAIMFWMSLMQLGFGLICAGYDGDMSVPSWVQWPWVALIALGGLGAHFCLTKALSLAPASLIIPIDFLRLPLIAVVGWLLYSEEMSVQVVLGGAVIFMSNYYNILHESPTRRPAREK